jgi:hypothetical protein
LFYFFTKKKRHRHDSYLEFFFFFFCMYCFAFWLIAFAIILSFHPFVSHMLSYLFMLIVSLLALPNPKLLTTIPSPFDT